MKYIITLSAFIAFLQTARAQPPKDLESSLANAYSRINYWASYDYRDTTLNSGDSLVKANDQFQALLLEYANKYPETLSMPLTTLADSGLTIRTSEDGLFRIYSWDTETGGTMHFFRNIFQYHNRKGTFATLADTATAYDEMEDPRSIYLQVNGIEAAGKTYYVARHVAIGSSAVQYHEVKIFSIEDYGLNDTAKLIQTQTGIRNALGFEIDFSDLSNRDNPVDRAEAGTAYDPATKTISISLIDGDGKLTARKIRYRFNGKYFVKLTSQ